ncbi:MAG: NUDIX hydrolase [Pseudorhodoplanes sp.]
MDGLTRADIERDERKDFALAPGYLRPRDAATLMLLDRKAGAPQVLMGRRHRKHAFMPGKFVFPGGRTDPADSRLSFTDDLPAADIDRIAGSHRRATVARARAIAASAIRETYEEAGLLIGQRGDFAARQPDWQGFVSHGVQPTLACLRLVARAITPPGRVRRFDTRFFAAWRDDVAVELPDGGPTGELEELIWLPIEDAMLQDVPLVTKTILGDLQSRLRNDPELAPGATIPFYHMRHNRFRRDLL